MSSLKPIEPRASLADEAYAALRREILQGVLAPEFRLREPQLAAQLDISRTPLREALRRLEQEGLVERRRGGGLHVVRFTVREASEVIGIRAVLEGYAARLASEQITAQELELLRQAHQRATAAIEAQDIDSLFEANTVFHDLMTAASSAPLCIEMIQTLRDRVLAYRLTVISDESGRQRSFDQHAAILKALERRDADLVERLVREHIAETARVIQRSNSGAAETGESPIVIALNSDAARKEVGSS